MLDNSRSDALPPTELAFLESDLRAHAAAPVKFVITHRPSWIADPSLHRVAKQYNVRYWIAGHVHQLIHTEFDGVTYYALPSAGGGLPMGIEVVTALVAVLITETLLDPKLAM